MRTVGTGRPALGCTRTIRPVVRSPTSALPSGSIVSPTGVVSLVATTAGSRFLVPGSAAPDERPVLGLAVGGCGEGRGTIGLS